VYNIDLDFQNDTDVVEVVAVRIVVVDIVIVDIAVVIVVITVVIAVDIVVVVVIIFVVIIIVVVVIKVVVVDSVVIVIVVVVVYFDPPSIDKFRRNCYRSTKPPIFFGSETFSSASISRPVDRSLFKVVFYEANSLYFFCSPHPPYP